VDSLYAEFGSLVRAARRNADLTQAQLADAIGLTRTSVANIEAGRQRAFLETLYRVAGAVGCQPRELLPDVSTLPAERGLPEIVNTQEPAVQQWIKDIATAGPSPEERPY